MARNRKVFEESIRAGADAAWNGNWDQAIAAYQRALAEFPQDVGALTGLVNGTLTLDRVDWGSIGGSVAGDAGFLDLDGFRSWS